MTKTRLIAMLLALYGASSYAGVWGNWIAGGTSCDQDSVMIIDNGNTLSVLFNNFGVNMPQRETGDGLSSRKTCNFRIQLTPPKGYYLAGFRQVYSGGLIKSAGSSGQLNIRYNVGSVVGRPLPIVFRSGREIRPEDEASLFTKTYYNNLLVASCGGSTVYGINMSLTATRRSTTYDYIVGGLDSVDADFIQKVILIPEWALCP